MCNVISHVKYVLYICISLLLLLTNKNTICEEINSRFKSGNAC